MVEKQFKKGDVIFRQGDQGESLFDIKEGTVCIVANYGDDNEQKLAELKKDQFFGEMAVIEAYPRSATAVACDDVTVCEISSGEISEYFKSQPDKIIAIMKHLGDRIRDLSADFGEVNSTIQELGLGKDASSGSLLDKIKKFAKVYSSSKNVADIKSFESLKKIEGTAHSGGYSKDVASFSKGAIIFKEGEIGDCMYDIHTGRIGIYSAYGTPDEKCLTVLEMNKFFGEMGMIEDTKRSATAVVLDDETTLETISANDLKELFEKNPPKVEMILAHMSYRLRKLTNEYMRACKIVSEVSDAQGQVSDAVKNYQPSFYD